MKIFISHASANKQYGDALVDLLRGIGVTEDQIIYTSNPAYGIPLSQNIFKWLKTQISEKPFVIYLLSKEYYSSIACLNEMGAAWIIENEHAIVFTPGFAINSKEFQNGAIDPREIGFFLNDQERLLTFIQLLQQHFTITNNAVIINQKITVFLKEVEEATKNFKEIPQETKKPNDTIMEAFEDIPLKKTIEHIEIKPIQSSVNTEKKKPVELHEKFFSDILSGKLKDEEMILLQYIIETGRVKLGIGWQEQHEITKIEVWEEVNEIQNKLSLNYSSAIGKFEIRGYTEVSALTSANNPKEVALKSEIADKILYLPDAILEKINTAFENYKNVDQDDDLPF